MCGEKCMVSAILFAISGSPPHVRGKASSCSKILLLLRITPACAGKRIAVYNGKVVDKDHPRMCGEKLT